MNETEQNNPRGPSALESNSSTQHYIPDSARTVDSSALSQSAAHNATTSATLLNNLPDEASAPLSPKTLVEEATAPLSKNAQKKILKIQKRQEQKLERRAREKAAKAAKKAARKEEADERRTAAQVSGEMDGEEDREAMVGQKRPHADSPRRTQKKPRLEPPFNARIVVDLGFDEKMYEKEIISLVSQCAYCYSAHRRAEKPFSELLFTSLNKRTLARFESIGTYTRWRGVEFWREDYDQLWAAPPDAAPFPVSTVDEPDADKPVPLLRRCEQSNIVYLTADSDYELNELQEGETYIIGGVCDHNRCKYLCRDKAMEQGIRTARLPIGTYLAEMPSRKVLTVNQVLAILMQWVETRDWEKSIWEVMPKRKLKVRNRGGKGASQPEGEEGEEEPDDGGETDEEENEVESSLLQPSS